jgi:pimeloyl-ACP methyl ester carboxylesterase
VGRQWAEQGSGRPLVLLHGLGESGAAWDPVIGRLAAHRRVIAFDLPGFGRTRVLSPAVAPDPAGFALLLPEALREAGVSGRPDVVGHSLGGWIALEAARAGMVWSVVALAPAGLWRGGMPAQTRLRLLLLWWAARNLPGLTGLTLRTAAGRTLATLGLYGRPWAVPAGRRSRRSPPGPGFKPALHGQAQQRFRGGRDIAVPVTVAFGTRDAILGKRTARFRDELPPSHRWVTLPRCGHAPVWDDPGLLTSVILQATT